MTQRLVRVPVAFFAIVLGVLGLGTTWREAARLWGAPAWIGETIVMLGVAIWLILIVLYAAKWIWARTEALAEWRHPVICCFIGLIGMATLLVAIALLPYQRPLALALFVAGSAGQLAFGLWRTGRLWQGGRDPAATTPIMYLPLGGGNFVSAMAAGALGYPALGVLFFGAGIVSVVALESVILHRLYTAPELPVALRASMGIQPAPALVGCVAYLAVTDGRPDLFAQVLLGYGILQLLLLARLLARLLPWLRAQAFSAAYWAYTFSAAALAISALRFVERGMDGLYQGIAIGCFILANGVIGLIALGTLWLLVAGRLLPPPLVAPAA